MMLHESTRRFLEMYAVQFERARGGELSFRYRGFASEDVLFSRDDAIAIGNDLAAIMRCNEVQ